MNIGSKTWATMLASVAALIGFSLSMLVVVFMSERPQDPFLELTRFEYNPPALVCPGDVLNYAIEWEATRSGVLVFTATHHFGHDGTGGTAIIARAGQRGSTNIIESMHIADDPTFSIPNLPPGEYSRVLSIGTESESTQPVFVVFPYTIGDFCE